MDKKDIKELVRKLEHNTVLDMSRCVWEMKDTIDFAMATAFIDGVASLANDIIRELDKTESDCDENN